MTFKSDAHQLNFVNFINCLTHRSVFTFVNSHRHLEKRRHPPEPLSNAMQRPLLPRPRDTDIETPLRVPPPKRQHIGPHGPIASQPIAPKRRPIASACESCRRRKEKCDGGRPICGPCARRGVDCSNVVESQVTSSSRAVREQYAALKQENTQLNELYSFLYRLDYTEATQVLARLRASGDPIAVLRDVKDSYLLLSNPDNFEHPTFQHPILERLDSDALRESTFRVNARPWTVVAGDGIVSELITSFFTWDDAFFYPFIHRRAFLDDMRQNNIDTAKYCSPFLVNAICATRCVSPSRNAHTLTYLKSLLVHLPKGQEV